MKREPSFLAASTLCALALAFLLSLALGASAYSFDSLRADWAMRLPRTLGAVIVGSGLAMAATLLQLVTRNPLAEPGLLGINAGAALGVAIGLGFFSIGSSVAFMAWAGGGALLAAAFSMTVSLFAHLRTPQSLILVGIATSAMLGGLANGVLMSITTALDQFRFWNLGSLTSIRMENVKASLPLWLAVSFFALLLARPLTILQLGKDKSKTMGVPVGAVTLATWGASAAFTGLAVAMAGPITFAGFLAAFLAQRAAGPHVFARLLLSSAFGAILVLASDVLARVVIRPFEVPVAVVIALLGTPLTVFVVARNRAFRAALVGEA